MTIDQPTRTWLETFDPDTASAYDRGRLRALLHGNSRAEVKATLRSHPTSDAGSVGYLRGAARANNEPFNDVPPTPSVDLKD